VDNCRHEKYYKNKNISERELSWSTFNSAVPIFLKPFSFGSLTLVIFSSEANSNEPAKRKRLQRRKFIKV
jgi:hypothetical protein